MKKTLLAVAPFIFAAGCAVQGSHNLVAEVPGYPQQLQLSANSVTVVDVSQTKSTTEFTLGLGFERLADSLYQPRPAEMLKIKIEQSIRPSTGSKDVDIFILDSGIHVKRQIEDRMPIINIFAYGSTIRPYMCSALAVIKIGTKSERKTFSITTAPIDPKDDSAFLAAINQCQFDLVKSIFNTSKELL